MDEKALRAEGNISIYENRIEVDSASYAHRIGSHGESVTLTTIELSKKDIRKKKEYAVNTYLGCLISTIYKCLPIIRKYDDFPEQHPPDSYYDELKEVFATTDERNLCVMILEDCLRLEYISHHPRVRSHASLHLYDIMEYLELCFTDTSYCTIENLAMFSSVFNTSLKPPEKTVYSLDRWRDVQQGTLNLVSKSELQERIKILQNGATEIYDSYDIRGFRLSELCMASLYIFFSEGKAIRRCENCGQLFVPENKVDTKYCLRASPQYETMACGEAVKYIKQQNSLKGNDLRKLYKIVYNTLLQRMNTATQETFFESESIFTEFKAANKKQKKNFELGIITEDEYRNWLEIERKKGGKRNGNSKTTDE